MPFLKNALLYSHLHRVDSSMPRDNYWLFSEMVASHHFSVNQLKCIDCWCQLACPARCFVGPRRYFKEKREIAPLWKISSNEKVKNFLTMKMSIIRCHRLCFWNINFTCYRKTEKWLVEKTMKERLPYDTLDIAPLCFVIFICTILKKNSSVYINFLTGLNMWMILSFWFHPILTFPVWCLWSVRSIVAFNSLWKLKTTILFRFLMF